MASSILIYPPSDTLAQAAQKVKPITGTNLRYAEYMLPERLAYAHAIHTPMLYIRPCYTYADYLMVPHLALSR
jgi:hypothetical protein